MNLLRAAARFDATALLADPEVAVVDTETTDLYGEVVDVAVLDRSGASLIDTLVHPSAAIVAEASAVHGLVDVDVVDAPRFREVAAELRAVLDGRTVVAYKADYDRDVILAEFARVGMPAPSCRWVCAMDLYTAHLCEWDADRGRLRARRLPAAGHRAAADCRALLDLLHVIAESPVDA